MAYRTGRWLMAYSYGPDTLVQYDDAAVVVMIPVYELVSGRVIVGCSAG